jgi:SAM-dependent methyltransferase
MLRPRCRTSHDIAERKFRMESENDPSSETTPRTWHDEYTERYYGGKPGLANSWDLWAEILRKNVPKNACALEVGGGRVNFTTKFMCENARLVVGVDVDPLVKTNALLGEAYAYDGAVFPLESNRFDVVVSRWVNEHVPNPEAHFREIHRVLAPGGCYIFRTVNRLHYTALAARCTPHRTQIKAVRWLKHHDDEHHYDAYEAFYRVNSRRRIEVICKQVGLDLASFRISEFCSAYGKRSKLMFHLFMWYERLVNSSTAFEGLRHTIDCVARKPLPSESPA